MPLLARDVWPGDSDGTGHTAGIECSCFPWCYLNDFGMTVVVHRNWSEQIIFLGSGCGPGVYEVADDAAIQWLTVEVENP